MSETPEDIIEKMKGKLEANPEVSAKINLILQFVVSGEGGGSWWLDLTRTPGKIEEGMNDGAACKITMAAADFVAMVNNEANPINLFMSGKLKLEGDMPAAMKLQSILDL